MNPLALALLRLVAHLPLPLLHGAGTLLGWLAWLVPNPVRAVVRRNLALCYPDMKPGARRRLARRSLVELGKAIAETPKIWLADGEAVLGLIREVQGGEWVEQALNSKQGLLVAIPHLGDWEICGLYMSRYDFTALFRPPRQTRLGSVMRAGRERLGAKLVPTDAGGIRALHQALRRGGAVAILPDQDPRDQGGAFAPFFGVAANTPTLLSRLAHKSGAPAVFCFAERLARGRGFRLHLLPAPAGIDSADAAVATAAVNRGVEQCVALAPAQYQWAYKRFRTRPQGEPPIY